MIDSTPSYTNQPGAKKKKNFVMIIVVIVVLVIAGIFIYRQSKEPNQTKVAVTPKQEPTPTKKPKIDKKSVKIQVLNGTGTPGQAGDAVEALEKAGYNSDNMTTGNADEFDQSVTAVTARAGFEEVARDVKKALEEIFDEVKIESSELDSDSEFDIVVVTGGKIFEEPTTSPSPTTTNPTETLTPTETTTPTPTPTPTP